MPKISVVMPSYNHALYIGKAIESVLQQSFEDFEFLISDDGSDDNTNEIIEEFSDKRIKFYPNKENRGACVVHNELISASSGRYIALINSDDMWVNGKLEKQFHFLEKNKNIAAHFGRAIFIDAQDKKIDKNSLSFGNVFDQPNRTQAQWLRYFFDNFNCLCHPSSMIRRECYTSLGGYNNRFRQLPDFDMWVRLVKKYPIFVDKDPLIYFRILSGKNASASTHENNIRVKNEHFLIAKNFFQNVSDELFLEGFSDRLYSSVAKNNRNIEIEKIFQYLYNDSAIGHIYKNIAYTSLFDALETKEMRNILKFYHIDDRIFQSISGNINLFPENSNVERICFMKMILMKIKHRIIQILK